MSNSSSARAAIRPGHRNDTQIPLRTRPFLRKRGKVWFCEVGFGNDRQWGGALVSEIASKGQLRLSFLRWAMFAVPSIMFLGLASGLVSGSGADNSWYVVLAKPAFNPPGWVFGAVWPVLYLLIGLAFSIVLNARRAKGRGLAITLFLVQFICNLFWSPLFFGAHEATLAFYLLPVILALSIVTSVLFARIRTVAGLLMLPYLAWLGFASVLAYEVDRLNPDAERLVPPAAHTQIR